MRAVWLRARSELRSRWTSILVLGLIVGVLGGVVIAAAAGARRTQSAYPRFVEAQHGLDAVVGGYRDKATFTKALNLPDVAESTILYLFPMAMRTQSGRTAQPLRDIYPLVSPDGGFGTRINRIKILEGRAADPDRVDELVLSFTVARKYDLGVGDRVHLFPSNPYGSLFVPGPRLDIPMRIVGIGASPGMFQPLSGGYVAGVHLTPAFYRRYKRIHDPNEYGAAVRLRPGVSVDDFSADLAELNRSASGRGVGLDFSQPRQTAGVQQATRAQSISLWALAAILFFAGLAIFSQTLSRQTFLESAEYPTLRSLGLSPLQLWGVGTIRAGAIATVGAAVAVAVAVGLSPLFPVGVARIAEPDPGFALDVPIVALGGAVTLIVVVLVGGLLAWRAARISGGPLGLAELPDRTRSAVVPKLLSRLRLRPSAESGVRMALEAGRGRTAVPVRSTMLGTTLGVIALTAALAFSASLDHLVATPRLSGWNWDAVVGLNLEDGARPSGPGQNINEQKIYARFSRVLETSPSVQAVARGQIPNVFVRGRRVQTLALDPVRGLLTPSLVDGRLPVGSNEILLGTETARSVDAEIGDTVRAGTPGARYEMRVVGRIAMPSFFEFFTRPGEGAFLTPEGAAKLSPETQDEAPLFFLRFAPGHMGEAIRTLQDQFPSLITIRRQTSQDVANLSGVSDTPVALAGVLALLAAAILGQTLVSSLRRRRRDLAILKTLGFVRRQVSTAVACQATTLTVVALAAGIPLGAMAGRWGWNVLAERLGVVPEPVVPLLVLVVVPVALALANVIAFVPGRFAARIRPAVVLRTE